ncbi:MAG: GH92 family glycosyl hydrolase [Saprospiraceae bacterium]|nr:GH92 family glycosyl hydrolase [Saprospiraceae bacterium]
MTKTISSRPMPLLLGIGLSLFIIACQEKPSQQSAFDAIQYVDPQLGAVHARWFFYTPAARPFGMAKLAPHTNAYESIGSWMPGGYDDRQTSIEGFGHFHEFQIGGVVDMPFTGIVKSVPGTLDDPDGGYRSRFDKSTETSEPGYYSVVLKDYHIKAELTATERVGFHRYTFPASDSSGILFDIGHKQGESSDVIRAVAELVNGNEIEGSVETYPEYCKFCDPDRYVTMYFCARLNKQPESVGTFLENEIQPGNTKTEGIHNGIYLRFPTTENEIVEMQVGVSYTSIANARLNLDTESKGQTFDAVHQTATATWNDWLSRIQVEGGSRGDKTKFYTGLYHALLGRGIASDVNGQYKLHGPGIGQIPLDNQGQPTHHHFNTDGMWGGFWNLSQLWSLAYPDYYQEYLQSNLDFYQETGWLHDGEAAGAYTNGVQTNVQGLLLAAAYNCGLRDFDVESAYQAAVKNELQYHGRNLGNGKYDLHRFVNLHYVPFEDTTLSNGWVFNFGTSHTVEYAFTSFAVAQFARALGHQDDYQKLLAQSDYWRNIFDPETKFIRPRYADGTFLSPFDPMKPWVGFQEGNAYQYTWYVPQDPAALVDVLGKDLFNERLENTFEESRKSVFGGGKELDSFSGLEKLYNQGNQPCLFHPWLFNYSGKPWLTQKWTRIICDEFYGTEPLHGYGYGQDEDQGQLGAWYVLAALGLFDVQGHAAGRPTFQFGSPVFPKVTIAIGQNPGKSLVIETENNGPEHYYIREASFQGKSRDNCWIYRDELIQGGVLHFVMDSLPNTTFGTQTPPPSGDAF